MKSTAKHTKFIVQAALIAAIYVAVTYAISLTGLASGAIQIRISEALTVMPYFTPAAVPGLFIGCILANMLTGGAVLDIVFGSLATLTGAVFTYLLRRKNKYLAPLPPIIANALVIPPVLMYVYDTPESYVYLLITVTIGEIISCGVFGIMLLKAFEKHRDIF